MVDFYNKVIHIILAWMPVLVQISLLSYVMFVLRRNYFSHEEAAKSEKIRKWRKSMPFWPLLAGLLWGAIPWTPRLWFITTYMGALQQGLCAGMLSMFVPWVVDTALKKKGIETRPDLPGDSDFPEANDKKP
jgi:hypothetical protein